MITDIERTHDESTLCLTISGDEDAHTGIEFVDRVNEIAQRHGVRVRYEIKRRGKDVDVNHEDHYLSEGLHLLGDVPQLGDRFMLHIQGSLKQRDAAASDYTTYFTGHAN